MITILSPAKTLDFSSEINCPNFSHPTFIDEANYLVSNLKNKTIPDLVNLMSISSSIAEVNYNRYNNWSIDVNELNARQSIFCFKGGVYLGLDVNHFSVQDLNYAQNYLRIISGLYGVLRPLDLIQPYRLEMGTRLNTERGNNLYQFWGDKITLELNKLLLNNQSQYLLNLSSNEYFKSILIKKFDGSIINVKFLDKKNGSYKVISFFAKKARGSMAAFIMQNRIKEINELKEFNGLGYSFSAEMSDQNNLTFVR